MTMNTNDGDKITWIPQSIDEHSTKELVDQRQSETWDAGRNALRSLAKGPHLSSRDRKELASDHYREVARDIEQIATTAPSGHTHIRPQVFDLFGVTRRDAELLSTAGSIDQPLNPESFFHEIRTSGTPVRFVDLPTHQMMGVSAGLLTVITIIQISTPAMAVTMGVLAALMATGAFFAYRHRQTNLDVAVTGPPVVISTGEELTSFTAGVHDELSLLMEDVLEVSTGWDDIIWSFYEEITGLAVEASEHLDATATTAGGAAAAYNDTIDELVKNLDEVIAERRAKHTANGRPPEIDQASQRELPQREDGPEDTELLRARLDEILRAARRDRRDLT
ncbi:hypothetical protein ACT3SZ_15115 [Corynebacterium sp. AOP40-9SA-29]|uniref:hypothetical protein n=1 Tax=Corynebacterium sp. AOP40-9SA-29 TaxID=3457677 RepID=UPI00403435D5